MSSLGGTSDADVAELAGDAQVAADGGSRHLVSVVVLEVPGDGVGAGVQAGVGSVRPRGRRRR